MKSTVYEKKIYVIFKAENISANILETQLTPPLLECIELQHRKGVSYSIHFNYCFL